MSHGAPATSLRPADVTLPAGHPWNRLPWVGLALGVLGCGSSALLGAADPRQFLFSWLVAFLFFLSIALGGLFFVLTHFATGASWSVVVRRPAESMMLALPFFLLLFLPVYFGRHQLYTWLDPAVAEHDPLLAGKRGFLNDGFFSLRALLYFLAWGALAGWFWRLSRRQDETRDRALTRRLIQTSAPALIVFAVTVSFAAIDWIMSLDPHWYSTMFGVYYFSGSLVGFFAVQCIAIVAMRRAGLLAGTVTVEHVHDLGKLLFAFTVFWAYIAFSQYFLIWYGNIPEETALFVHRSHGGWGAVSALLAWGHFLVPFFFLMPRTVKRRSGPLVAGALWMLLMHFVDLYWLVMPTLHPEGLEPRLLDLTTFVGVGGCFLLLVSLGLRRAALVPVGDPRLAESLSFENA